MNYSKCVITLLSIVLLVSVIQVSAALESSLPQEHVKLIFIHHSCGENWLEDDNGGLGIALDANNYYVSDTNYGWGPDSIGDATDYHNWVDWFIGSESNRYLTALYSESGKNSYYTRTLTDPSGENRIIMFKSCYPNSDLSGSPGDPPNDGDWYTIGHAKYVYNQLLDYFETRQDKLFIAITPPPVLDASNAANAREFSRWLVEDWLADYPYENVGVWDMHNVLTDPDNHHRYGDGGYEYEISNGPGTLYYDSDGDEHPNKAGNLKCTSEFVSILNYHYNLWSGSSEVSQPVVNTTGSLEVYVEDVDQNPLEGVTVTSTGQPSGQTRLNTVTPLNGSVSFSGVKTGSYSIRATLEGYESWETSTIVDVNGTTTVTITLSPEQENEQEGIPGFPGLSVAAGLILGIYSLKMVKRVRGLPSASL